MSVVALWMSVVLRLLVVLVELVELVEMAEEGKWRRRVNGEGMQAYGDVCGREHYKGRSQVDICFA